MPKHYKEMIDEIINKMDEQKESNLRYSVKFAYKKGGKIANAFYDNKTDAEKFMKSVISKGGKAILTTEDAPANSVASGGVDMNPTGAVMSPKMMKRKKEQGDIMTPEIEQEVFCTCFGIDVYEVEDKLVSEGEYAKTL